jgi:UDPglucose--hexose-1-phosphate uridylyltransferase
VSPVRWDPYTGEPVLIAPERAARPHDAQLADDPDMCPFCPGSEDQTPPEVLAVRPGGGDEDGPGWQVRVFPNKFPALASEEGIHEVIVNTPRHVRSLADLTDEEVEVAAAAWSERLAATAADPRGLWPFWFLNQGAAAGASLQHSHAQLVGLPFAPPRLVTQQRAFDEASRCLVCAEIAGAGDRLVGENGELVAWCPEVPPLSGAVRVAPRTHFPDWAAGFDPGGLGRALRDLCARIQRAFGTEAINLWLLQRGPGGSDAFHWHVDGVPRLGTLAGLELGSGVIAAAYRQEVVAERLRAATT